MKPGEYIEPSEFHKLEIRVGTVLAAEVFGQARKPALKIRIDFGDYGIRKTSAQITRLYRPEDLPGKQVVAVVNLPPKQIAKTVRECLVLGGVDGEEVTLLAPDKPVKNGLRIG
mgnify:CR=1 FL=1